MRLSRRVGWQSRKRQAGEFVREKEKRWGMREGERDREMEKYGEGRGGGKRGGEREKGTER